tara:strand:- start:839 stop:1069 length:231 start_codon:yes stop_codon:yes gene_type:complete
MEVVKESAPVYKLERPKTSYMDLTQTRARKLYNPQYISKISTRLDKPYYRKAKSPSPTQKVSRVVEYENKYASKKV